jgi:hypothetical protein
MHNEWAVLSKAHSGLDRKTTQIHWSVLLWMCKNNWWKRRTQNPFGPTSTINLSWNREMERTKIAHPFILFYSATDYNSGIFRSASMRITRNGIELTTWPSCMPWSMLWNVWRKSIPGTMFPPMNTPPNAQNCLSKSRFNFQQILKKKRKSKHLWSNLCVW